MKVFINDADLPLGKTLSKIIKDLSKLAIKPENDADESANTEQSWLQVEIYGTASTTKPPFLPPEANSTFAGKSPTPLEKFTFSGILHEWIVEVKKDDVLQAIDQCDAIVLNCPENPLDKTIPAIIEHLSNIAKNRPEVVKTVIFVSNVMTWFRSELTDIESALTEEDHRKRKCHPNFKWLMDLEKSVSKITQTNEEDLMKTSNIKPYVVCSGIVYHPFDGLFHSLLRNAWKGNDSIYYGTGDNILPTIHLFDLCNIIAKVIDRKPESNYILAVDDSKPTYAQLIKAISETLGNGVVNKKNYEDIALDKSISSYDADMLRLNLRLDASTAKELFQLTNESGPVENIKHLVQEYKYCRNLEPVCVFIHGPPLSGKTTLAQKLADQYQISHLDPTRAIDIYLSLTGGDELKEKQQAVKAQMMSSGKLEDAKLTEILQEILSSMKCRNHGYIIAEFPESHEQAVSLFGDQEEKLVIPNYIIDMEISDDILKDRLADEAHEEAFLKRLEAYRTGEKEETTVLDFFEEKNVAVSTVSCGGLSKDALFDYIKSKVIGFHGYGPTREEIDIQHMKNLENERLIQMQKAEADKKAKEEEDARKRAQDLEWEKRISEIKKQELEILEARSAPLRKYLVDNIMPTLTAALVEVAKVRPADPTDYVAEYLFKHSKLYSSSSNQN